MDRAVEIASATLLLLLCLAGTVEGVDCSCDSGEVICDDQVEDVERVLGAIPSSCREKVTKFIYGGPR